MEQPCVGISSCLTGEKVRYDGSDKLHASLVAALSEHFTLVPVCPEVEMGLETPRQPVQLVDARRVARRSPNSFSYDGLFLLGVNDHCDYTAAFLGFVGPRLEELDRLELSGYVLKSASPSCGLDMPVFDAKGIEVGRRPGLFAAALEGRFAGLPVAEETELEDATRRASFVDEVLQYHRDQHG